MHIKSTLKNIWYHRRMQILRNRLCYILKSFGIKPDKVFMQRMSFKGVFTVHINKKNSFRMQGTGFALENGIFWKGFFNHEPFTMQTFLQQLHSAGWFVDVGSNAGIFSLAACSMRPDVKVFAIEPMPQFFKLLQQNISLNGFNISAFQLAMSNQTGIIPIYFPHHLEGNIYSASLSLSHFKHHQSTAPNIIEVQRLRFDDLIQNYQLPGQGIIKIDAEGHGVEVLEGMRDTIQKHCPAIIIEVMSASEADQISNILKGYSYFGIMEDCCQLTGRLHIPFAPGCNNYLCLH